MITLKTIKSGDLKVEDIDLDVDDAGYYYLKQYTGYLGESERIVLTKQSLIELGQYLVKLDLD